MYITLFLMLLQEVLLLHRKRSDIFYRKSDIQDQFRLHLGTSRTNPSSQASKDFVPCDHESNCIRIEPFVRKGSKYSHHRETCQEFAPVTCLRLEDRILPGILLKHAFRGTRLSPHLRPASAGS